MANINCDRNDEKSDIKRRLNKIKGLYHNNNPTKSVKMRADKKKKNGKSRHNDIIKILKKWFENRTKGEIYA